MSLSGVNSHLRRQLVEVVARRVRWYLQTLLRGLLRLLNPRLLLLLLLDPKLLHLPLEFLLLLLLLDGG